MTPSLHALRLFLATLVVTDCGAVGWSSPTAAARAHPDGSGSPPPRHRGFEVWIADQSDTRPGHGGQILIYDGASLYGRQPEQAQPSVRLDLGARTAELCRAATGRPILRSAATGKLLPTLTAVKR